MKEKLVTTCIVLLCSFAACSHHPETGVPLIVRQIEIRDTIQPEVLYAKPGEEIRWENFRSMPVQLGFLTTNLLKELGCEKGVATLFGEVNDLITIRPQESVSLCFVHTGELKYNVWFDPGNPRGAISPTATVRVEKAS